MPSQRPPRTLSVLAGALAAAGLVLAVADCTTITPLGPDAAPNMPPARQLRSPIIMQVMHSRQPTLTGGCPAGSIALFGSDPAVPRASVVATPAGSPVPVPSQLIQGSTTTAGPPTPTTPPGPPVGVACFLPVGRPVTITSAAVSSVSAYQHQQGPASYGFVVAFPTTQVAALTALIRQAYDSGDALGMSVAGKLWQAPQPRGKFIALRAAQINLLSRSQAVQLYRLLIPSG